MSAALATTTSHRPSADRQDGWTPDRRITFLAAIAEGHTVEAACRAVGLSVASAYALRRRAGGEAFALGWRAACLLARDRLVDLLTSRAIDGQTDTYTRADGTEITRHRHDNRLGLALLTRLDRLAERPAMPVTPAAPAAPIPAPTPDESEAARLAAEAFPRFLEETVTAEPDADALQDFITAAAADRIPQLPQLRLFAKGKEWLVDFDAATRAEVETEPVWLDEADGEMLTLWAPPPGFTGTEYGIHGERTYARTLSDREAEADALHYAEADARAAALDAEDAAEAGT